jgi:predicted ATP-dependent endonuclease of OLD family
MNIMVPVAKSLLETDGSIKKELEKYEKISWVNEKDESKRDAAYFLLNHIEKGEFAQALADHLSKSNEKFAVPEYIRNAVIWACGGEPDAA